MQAKVFDVLIEEKKKGGNDISFQVIIFKKLKNTCDRVAIIKDGEIIVE